MIAPLRQLLSGACRSLFQFTRDQTWWVLMLAAAMALLLLSRILTLA